MQDGPGAAPSRTSEPAGRRRPPQWGLHAAAHVLFWLVYFGFRTAAAEASTMPIPPEWEAFPFLTNRIIVVSAYALLTGALLLAAMSAWTRRIAQWRPLIVIAGAAALLPVMQTIEDATPGWLWPTALEEPPTPFVIFSFQFGWALVLWGALQAIIAYHFLVLDQTRAVARERALAYDAQLKMLRYQINPHFLFNTLNAISALVLERRSDQAERMLMRLSGFLRHSLDRNPNDVITLAGEMEAQRKYLEIEQTRLGDKLDVQFDIAPETLRATLPSLLLQPIVENAIKHAISPNESGGRIDIRARRDGDLLRIWIDDDGPGAAATAAQRRGLGLANARERLNLMYHERSGLIAQNRPQGGFGVQIWLPFEEEVDLERAVARSAG